MIPGLVRAVVFDAVGTLLFPEPPAAEVYAAVGRKFGSGLSVGPIAARFREAFAIEEAADREAGFRTSKERELRRWRDIVGHVLADAADADSCFRELFAHFARPEAWRCLAGAGDVLARLHGQGLRLALASNYDARLRPVAAGHPELRWVSHLFISSEMGWRKPAPEFYVALCRGLGVPPAQVVFLGDDPVNDFGGSTAAGLVGVLFDPAERYPDLRPRVGSLTVLAEWLGGKGRVGE